MDSGHLSWIGMMAGRPTESSALAEAGLTTLASQVGSLPSDTPISVRGQVPVSAMLQTGSPIFYSLSHPEFPPLPFNPFPDLPLYGLGEGLFLYDDREVDYVRLRAEAQEAASLGFDKDFLTPEGMFLQSGLQTEGEGTLTISRTADGLVLTVTGLQNSTQYALLSKENLWQPHWRAERVFMASENGQWTKGPFQPDLPTKFYQVVRPPVVVWVECYCDAVITPRQNGKFVIRRQAPDYSTPLTVSWTIGGTATLGDDYYLPYSASIPPGEDKIYVEVVLNDPHIDESGEHYETVTLTLTPTDTYYVSARHGTATVRICDQLFFPVSTDVGQAIGIDFYPVQGNESLLISNHYESDGYPCNFTRIIKVDGSVQAVQWSDVKGLPEEIKVTTVKQSVANFQQGDMFFGYVPPDGGATRIGRVYQPRENVVAELNWAILQTGSVTETCRVRGGLYVDQTGLFDHDLIVVTGGAPDEGGRVWRIGSDANHNSQNIRVFAGIPSIQQPSAHLEGLLTLPDDDARYGPWAGKILTGDESSVVSLK